MISVVMPLYNNEKEVQRAIASVLAQSYQQFELIVVNDGSTDNSLYIVQSYRDDRITVIHQKNQGVSAARNIGIRAAQYDLVAFLDADDEWKPDFLKTIAALSEEFAECAVYGTHYYYMDQRNRLRTPVLRGLTPVPFRGILKDYFSIAAQSDPPFWSSAIAVRKPTLESVGYFPVGVTIGEDLLTWACLALRYPVAYTTERCAIFHLKAPLAGVPSRVPQEPDVVGISLEKLLGSVPPAMKTSFARYIALWHRMRAAMYLGLRDRTKTLKEVRASVRYDPINVRAYAYAVVAALPGGARDKLYDVFSYLKTRQRKITS